MEEKINIAEILENKSQGTKLYSLTYGDCFYQEYTGDFGIECQSQNGVQFNLDEYGKYCIDGECIIFPSKEMRDWEKFAWKRGDVLVNSRGLKILFDRWANDNYTSFYAKTINLVEDSFLDTNLHTLASEKDAKSFIKCIEEKLGGKLNRETLKIEKAQPEVCQFTGLTDCKGNEIWEGDIAECETYDLYKGFIKVKAIIEYMYGAFVAIIDGMPYSLYFKYIKVIGNKFDKDK